MTQRKGKKGCQLATGLLFKESQGAVGNQQDHDDGEVRPVVNQEAQQCSTLDHDLHGSSELFQEHLPQRFLLLGHFIQAILLHHLGHLGICEALQERFLVLGYQEMAFYVITPGI